MVRRGVKRAIDLNTLRETKQQRSVACSKRRKTVFKKASDLCRYGGAKMAVFVTSPAEGSDVVYSFSGNATASEIAGCYLNGKKAPTQHQSKLGLDASLYERCENLGELRMMEERCLRLKEEILRRIANLQNSNQNPNPSGPPVQNPVTFGSLDQNPNFSYDFFEGLCDDGEEEVNWDMMMSFDSQLQNSNQNPNSPHLNPITISSGSLDQNPITSGSPDQIPNFSYDFFQEVNWDEMMSYDSEYLDFML